jgi:class 3 adenylate cyclase/tetratricopeptide (TPR) repeat protein
MDIATARQLERRADGGVCLEAERRQVVILFADMVGFTAFSERFGEEAAFGLIQALSQLVEHAVEVEGAHIHNIAGDGVVVAFGAPVAVEDAPLRACRAALSILETLRASGSDIEVKHGIRPELRIGINVGPAVVGQLLPGGETGVSVLGDTVNVAARLQSLSEPGAVLLSEAAYRLVDGLVEATFAGEHLLKGRSGPERVYRLEAIRRNASRFDASLNRGLTAFVGRDRELDLLEHSFESMGSGVQVVDIVGEPGIGKTRLLHEFRAHAARRRAWMLAGVCAPDGQQTPFRVFIDIIRSDFRVALGDEAGTVESKLDEGLRAFGLSSEQNLGLLLNLLGREAPRGALSGLDGVLMGLRTRDLLVRIVRARSRQAPLILMLEDIHWLDSASEALLSNLIAIDDPLPILILHTRRPAYAPPWAGGSRVARLALDPLSARETSRLAQARLGVAELPAELGALIAAKAEGNALFAEEIVSFLLERGVITFSARGVAFDSSAVTATLPHSIQSILASRVDQLPREARALLQTAAVIGRRFDPDLVLALTDGPGLQGSSFAAMEAQDLVRRDEPTGDYTFKHGLVRDAIYDGLLSRQRAALHMKVGEELERRSSNSILENAETLALHFEAAGQAPKAIQYLALAARKSLNVYGITEAEAYFRKALDIFEQDPSCAEPLAASRVVVGLLETLMLESDYRQAGQIAEKYMPVVKRAGETRELVTAYYYQTLSLVQRYELRAGLALMIEAVAVAERIGDGRAMAFARAGLLHCRTRLGLDTLEEAERRKTEVMADSLRFGDNFLRNSAYFFITWDYLYRGLVKDAREIALRLIASEEAAGDPRAIGFANWILGWINVIGGSPDAARGYADECLRVAIAPFDRLQGEIIKAIAAILFGHPREGLPKLEALNVEFERLGALYSVLESPRGVALIETGRVAEGVRLIERTIAARDASGDRTQAAFARILLAEVYIQILAGGRKPPMAVLIRNLPALAAAKLRGTRRAAALLETAASHQQLSRDGVAIARIDFDRGQLFAMRGKRREARECFERARGVAHSQGLDALWRRSEAALAKLA